MGGLDGWVKYCINRKDGLMGGWMNEWMDG